MKSTHVRLERTISRVVSMDITEIWRLTIWPAGLLVLHIGRTIVLQERLWKMGETRVVQQALLLSVGLKEDYCPLNPVVGAR